MSDPYTLHKNIFKGFPLILIFVLQCVHKTEIVLCLGVGPMHPLVHLPSAGWESVELEETCHHYCEQCTLSTPSSPHTHSLATSSRRHHSCEHWRGRSSAPTKQRISNIQIQRNVASNIASAWADSHTIVEKIYGI